MSIFNPDSNPSGRNVLHNFIVVKEPSMKDVQILNCLIVIENSQLLEELTHIKNKNHVGQT
jgi:hypothetical protein